MTDAHSSSPRSCLLSAEKTRSALSPPPTMYKSANYRKSQQQPDAPAGKFHQQAKQLQEAFPTWSYDGTSLPLPSPALPHRPPDLHSLLIETNGDGEQATTWIIEGPPSFLVSPPPHLTPTRPRGAMGLGDSQEGQKANLVPLPQQGRLRWQRPW